MKHQTGNELKKKSPGARAVYARDPKSQVHTPLVWCRHGRRRSGRGRHHYWTSEEPPWWEDPSRKNQRDQITLKQGYRV